MKAKLLLSAAILVVVNSAGFAFAETMTTVECEKVKVIMDEEQVAAIKANTGEENFATDVCTVASKIDASTYAEPTAVNVQMPSGESYDLKLQMK